jgi:hypothetical protein
VPRLYSQTRSLGPLKRVVRNGYRRAVDEAHDIDARARSVLVLVAEPRAETGRVDEAACRSNCGKGR